MTKLSVVILSWNTAELLRQCLNSLKFEIRNSKFEIEILVVDNGSSDGSAEYVRQLAVDSQQSPATGNPSPITIKLIENKQNLGFSQGNNQGIKQAKGEYIMLLNSDTTVEKGALDILLNFLKKNTRVIVSPLLILPSGCFQNEYYMRFPNLWQIFFYHNPFLRPLALRLAFIKKLILQISEKEPFSVDQLPGAAIVAAGEVWREVGYLDDDYKFLFEDVDWCWRAKKKGFCLKVVPQARVVHLGGGSWKGKLADNKIKFYKQYFSSLLLFVKKNYSPEKLSIFKLFLMFNFLTTLKLPLFFNLIRNNFEQEKLWQ